MKKNSPAELYRQYRKTRAAGVHANPNIDLPSATPDESSSDVSQLYRAYQRTRPNDHSAQIDIVLQKIEIEKLKSETLSSIEREDSSMTFSETTPTISSRLSTLFSWPSNTITSLLGNLGVGDNASTGKFFSRGLPALAMLVLAVVLLPFLMKSENNDNPLSTLASATAIPESVFIVANDLTPSIDSAVMTTLGFSNNNGDNLRYFDLGTMVSDISIVTAADAINDHETVVHTLAQFAELETDGKVKQAINDLLVELTLVPPSRSAITTQINNLNQSVEETDSQQLKTQWYKLGKSVEVIDLSAGYLVESNSSIPLNDTLTQLREFPEIIPSNKQEELLVELLQELSLFGAVDTPTASDARKIDRLISRIRVLVK